MSGVGDGWRVKEGRGGHGGRNSEWSECLWEGRIGE